jgi:hypothetical protein
MAVKENTEDTTDDVNAYEEDTKKIFTYPFYNEFFNHIIYPTMSKKNKTERYTSEAEKSLLAFVFDLLK